MSAFPWYHYRQWTLGRSPGQAPILASIAPTTAVHGVASVALTVTGSKFTNGAKINFGASAYAATFVSQTSLTATIAAADLATAGSKNVTVTNADGKVSGAATFTIT